MAGQDRDLENDGEIDAYLKERADKVIIEAMKSYQTHPEEVTRTFTEQVSEWTGTDLGLARAGQCPPPAYRNAVFEGLGDRCTGTVATIYTDLLSEYSNTQGYCIIGNGEWDSWFMPLEDQVEIACEKVKNMGELSQGYNIVGLSQGNMIGRGVLEFCDGAPPVKNFISVAGSHAGLASIPFCNDKVPGLVCLLLESVIYNKTVQEHFAPASCIKIPTDLDAYRKGCKFLPKLNNEFEKNATYKVRFSSLQNLVLIKFDSDPVLVPKETSWFGYFPDGALDPILPPQETKLYIEDWIGLRMLDEAGRVKFVNVTGEHLDITKQDMMEHIVPYLSDKNTLGNPVLKKSNRYQPSLSSLDASGFMRKLVGQQDH
ncbi:uncharacterized protein LOC143541532 [Bidens hawaiensis]|uniref:uncharacterized protein LOC143541532 n=1 Tax=Bidens hawaiensis TaxID=980011 RepID=UPI00404AB8AE